MKYTYFISIVTSLVIISPCSALAKGGITEEELNFDRGIEQKSTVFVPRGTFAFGATVNYNNYSFGNGNDDVGYKMLFSALNGLKTNFTTFGVAPHISYFPIKNLSIGLSFGYDRTKFGLDSLNLTISEGTSMKMKNVNYFKQSYTAGLHTRYYMSIANSKRFGMFIDLCAAFSYGQSKTYSTKSIGNNGTYQDIYTFDIGLVPGLSVFVANNVAIELSIGVLGYSYQKVKQVTNQIYYSEMKSSGANYRINFLSINLGVVFHIPTTLQHHKNQTTTSNEKNS